MRLPETQGAESSFGSGGCVCVCTLCVRRPPAWGAPENGNGGRLHRTTPHTHHRRHALAKPVHVSSRIYGNGHGHGGYRSVTIFCGMQNYSNCSFRRSPVKGVRCLRMRGAFIYILKYSYSRVNVIKMHFGSHLNVPNSKNIRVPEYYTDCETERII